MKTKQEVFDYLVNRTIAISLQLGMARPMTEQFEHDMRALYRTATDVDPDCPFCHNFDCGGGKPIAEIDDKLVMLRVHGEHKSTLTITPAIIAHGSTTYIPICYCPMCGSHLDD